MLTSKELLKNSAIDHLTSIHHDFDDSSSLSHFNDTILKTYAGSDLHLMEEVIFTTKMQLLQSSVQLESSLVNNNLSAMKRVGDKIYGTAVSIGLPLLSKIARTYEQLEYLTINEVDNLFVETKKEIQLLVDVM